MDLLTFTEKGIYCPPADVFIDPWKPVNRALITHGHADHSRWGHQHYLCVAEAGPVIRYRLGKIRLQTIRYGESITINGVKFTFFPAGHIVGSAQIRAQYQGETWVVSGDYKIEDDGLSTPFEPVKCHAFISECTFGLPIYKWKDQATVFDQINQWWRQNQADGKVSVLTAYALGKAQRVLQHLDTSIGRIYTHGAIENTNAILRKQGIALHPTTRVTNELEKKDFIGQMVLATPSAIGSPWMKRFKPVSVAAASGWMQLRGARRRRGVDRGFVLSDHADWEGLNQAIQSTGAERVYVTHGYTDIFRRWLGDQGYDARIVKTEYTGEEETDEEKDTEA